MSWRTTLALFVALVVLGGAYVWMQRSEEQAVQQAEAAKRLFDWEAEAVTRMRLQPIEQKMVEGVRTEEGGWRITQPNPSIPPFVPLWDRMAAQLAGLMNERSIEPGALNPADYGLDVPVLEFEADAAGETIKLAFGSLEPTQERRYALLDGTRLFLVHKNAFFELNRTLDDLRNKFTVDDREANILRLEFAQIWTGEKETDMENPPAVGEESPPIVAERASATEPWKLVEPRAAAANQEIINAIVQEMQFAVARKFIDDVESLADYGLQPARLRITMADDKSAKAQTFYLGGMEADTQGLYVRRPDRDGVFVLDPQVLSLLPRTPDAFQERRLLTQQALDAERLVITHAGERTELFNDPEKGWTLVGDEGFDTDQAAVSTYITALKRAMGEKILLTEPAALGLDTPETQIELHPKGGGAPAVIRIQSNFDEPGYMAAQQDLGALMMLQQAQGQLLQADKVYFRSRKLWKLDAAAVKEIALDFEGTSYRFQRAHGIWAVTAPEHLKLGDNAALDQWLGRMAELRVVTPKPETGVAPEMLGLEAAILKATFTEESGAASGLAIGSPTAELVMQRYIRVDGKGDVYRVDQAIVDATRDLLAGLQAK